jgi:hypothetical protein
MTVNFLRDEVELDYNTNSQLTFADLLFWRFYAKSGGFYKTLNIAYRNKNAPPQLMTMVDRSWTRNVLPPITVCFLFVAFSAGAGAIWSVVQIC